MKIRFLIYECNELLQYRVTVSVPWPRLSPKATMNAGLFPLWKVWRETIMILDMCRVMDPWLPRLKFNDDMADWSSCSKLWIPGMKVTSVQQRWTAGIWFQYNAARKGPSPDLILPYVNINESIVKNIYTYVYVICAHTSAFYSMVDQSRWINFTNKTVVCMERFCVIVDRSRLQQAVYTIFPIHTYLQYSVDQLSKRSWTEFKYDWNREILLQSMSALSGCKRR